MALEVVTVLEKIPSTCMLCSCTPVDLEGRVLPMIDTHVDVNWGDNVYVCSECVDIMARLMGYELPEVVRGLREQVRGNRIRIQALTNELAEEQQRNEVLVGAKRAMREIRDRRKVTA